MTQVIRKLQFTFDEREADLLWAALSMAIVLPTLETGSEMNDDMRHNYEEAQRIMFDYSLVDGEFPEEGQPLAAVDTLVKWANEIHEWEGGDDAR